MIKKLFILTLILFFFQTVVIAAPPQRVNGYHKKNGIYVQTHYRTKADRRKINNYSAKGNYNPYTGKKGYTNLYKTSYKPKSYRYKTYKPRTYSYKGYRTKSYKIRTYKPRTYKYKSTYKTRY